MWCRDSARRKHDDSEPTKYMKTKLNRWLLCCAMWLLLVSALPVHAFYNPSTGRWLSRDPIGEQGGGESLRVCSERSTGLY